MTAPRPKCACCGKPYGSRMTTSAEVRWPQGQPMPAYRGNGIVIKTRGPFNTTEAMQWGTRDVWDGLTWFKPYEPFCTLRCALGYARASYEARKQAKRERERGPYPRRGQS
jgi:hypothetical protein